VPRPNNVPPPTTPQAEKYCPGYQESLIYNRDRSIYEYDIEQAPKIIFSGCSPSDVARLLKQLRPQVVNNDAPPLDEFPDVPTVSLYGRDEKVINPECIRETTATNIQSDVNSGIEARELPGGHFLHVPYPKIVVTEIFRLLYKQRHPEAELDYDPSGA
jgi:hypothetical protein